MGVASAQTMAGTYPLTAVQWSICEKYVSPPKDGLAEPCTDSQMADAYVDGGLPDEEYVAWSQQEYEAKEGRVPTYTTPPSGAPSALSTRGKPTGTPSSSINATGSPDYLSDLGLTSPFCGGPGLNSNQQQNCLHSGSPWASYPVGNYGLDINTGSNGGGILDLDVTGFVTGLLQEIANGLWMFGLYVLRAALTLVEIAFGLNLFGSSRALGGISGALTNLYQNFDVPWMGAVLAAIGLWGIWTGLIQRKHSYTIGATLASVAMVLVAMWIIAKPADTVGVAYQAANDAALDLVAAPSQGHLTDPQSSFSSAIESLWSQMVRGPWCALDFTSISFCNGKPEAAAVKLAAKDAYRDNGLLLLELSEAMSPSGGDCTAAASDAAACVQRYFETHQPYPPPATRADLYLRYSPGSQPRSDLWTYYHGTDNAHVLIFDVGGGHAGVNPEAVSIQGTDGWISRIGLLLLLGFGLLGVLLMLIWVAVRLVLQTCMGLILLVLAPIALVFPAFGENGRAMFAQWGKSLLGALISKSFYAAMLAAGVTGSSAISTLAGPGASFGLTFLLLSAFWWSLFLKRNEVLGLVQAGPRNALADPERGHVAARAAAGYGAVLAARYGLRQVAEGRSGRRQQNELTSRAETQGLRQAAYEELASLEQTKASNEIGPAKRDLAERDGLQQESRDTQRRVEQIEQKARRRQANQLNRNQGKGPKQPRELYSPKERTLRNDLLARKRALDDHLSDHQGRYARAEQIVGRESRQQLGEDALGKGEVDRRIERLRNGDRDPVSDQNLRAYAGITESEYESRSPAEQAALREQISSRIAREQALLTAVPPPEHGGIEHAPPSPSEQTARQALPPGEVRERSQQAARQLEERIGDRERERGLTRGVMHRRKGRRKRAEQIARKDTVERALAERDAQFAAARAQWRLDAQRRRGRGRP